MKVALINPRIFYENIHPLGMLYVGAVLERAGHEVRAYDYLPGDMTFIQKVKEWSPGVIGITVSTSQYKNALDIAKRLKEVMPACPIVFGGVHPTVLPDDVISNPQVDYVVYGEGEYTMRELCSFLESKKGSLKEMRGILYKENGRTVKTEPRELVENLDELPFPARHLLPSRWYYLPPKIRGVWTRWGTYVMASRGCPNRCIHCSSHLMFGRKVRRRSVENVLAELKHLHEKYDISAIWFSDDTFTLDRKWVLEFCDQLFKSGLKMKWACQSRVDTINEEMLSAMKKAGCVQLDFGVESGSQKVLNVMKKGVKVEKVIKAFELCRKAGIRPMGCFMVGTPYETMEDVKQTADLIDKIKPDWTEIFFTTPFPATELEEIARREGFLQEEEYNEMFSMGKQKDNPVICGMFSKKELLKVRSMLHNKVIFRNYGGMLFNPGSYWGYLKIISGGGYKGIIKGLKRFISTGKLDNVPLTMLTEYRISQYRKYA